MIQVKISVCWIEMFYFGSPTMLRHIYLPGTTSMMDKLRQSLQLRFLVTPPWDSKESQGDFTQGPEQTVMPGLDPRNDPVGTVLSSSPHYSVSDNCSSDSHQRSDDFDFIEPQSIPHVPFLDEKPVAWSRKEDHAANLGSLYSDSYSTLNGNRYGLQEEKDFQWPPRHAHAYRDRRYSKPLLEYVRNEWHNDLYADSSPPSPTFSDQDFPSWIQIVSAPRFRRYATELLAIMSVLTFIWGIWIGWVEPTRLENKALNESLNETMGEGQMLFGHNMTPAFLGMVHLKTLDRRLLPQKGSRKRLIVVGDVHGCHDERKYLALLPLTIRDEKPQDLMA